MASTVAVVVFDGVQLLDVAGPSDVFDAAGRLTGDPYELRTVSAAGGTVRSTAGIGLSSERADDVAMGREDTVLVPGTFDERRLTGDPSLREVVSRLAAGAGRVASVCTGSFVLAELGLLDGLRATTHWSAADRMRRRYPTVTVAEDELYVRQGRIATCGGVASGVDLALELVAEDHGREVARQAAKWLVVYLQRSGGQSQFGLPARLPVVREPAVVAALDRIAADPAGDHRVESLAAVAGLSRRHFTRVFREATGTTPAKHVDGVRLELARSLLETTDHCHDVIARRCGFADAERLRQSFVRRYGTSPRDHRVRFGPASR